MIPKRITNLLTWLPLVSTTLFLLLIVLSQIVMI